nr:MAG TPA: hypothetical protein [Caudoviricetes sp.]
MGQVLMANITTAPFRAVVIEDLQHRCSEILPI